MDYPSAAVFKTLLAVSLTLAAVTIALLPLQAPGTGGRVVSILALAVQGAMIAIAVAGLRFGWQPFRFLDEE